MTNIFYNNSAQTTLEIALAVALAIIFVVGAISSWNWFNKTMVERLEEYNSSRLAAIHDIRSSQFGMGVNYSKPNINIFSMDAFIKSAPSGAPVIGFNEGVDYSACYDALNASMAIVNQTRAEVRVLEELIGNITADTLNLKAELGTNVEVARDCFLGGSEVKPFMLWIYDSAQEFFNNRFSLVKAQYELKIFEEGMLGCIVSFWTPHQWNGSPVDVPQVFFTPGLYLEEYGNTTATERRTKEESANALETQAWEDFNICIEQEEPQDACLQSCRHFLDDSSRLDLDSRDASARGDFGLADDLMNLSQQAGENYNVCYHDCKMQDPCYADCYNNYGGPAEQALIEGRIEESGNLTDQFLECLGDC